MGSVVNDYRTKVFSFLINATTYGLNFLMNLKKGVFYVNLFLNGPPSNESKQLINATLIKSKIKTFSLRTDAISFQSENIISF